MRRTPSPQASCYTNHKSSLREDFNKRCGYCSDPDLYFGNQKGFHIDHFAPKCKFKGLENDYTNLVYSCPICNRAKWNKWVTKSHQPSHNGSEGFVDPCLDELDNHLGRNKKGQIIPHSSVGEFMVKHIKLFLPRHQIIWVLDELYEANDKLCEAKDKLNKRPQSLEALKKEALECIALLYQEIRKYTKALEQLR